LRKSPSPQEEVAAAIAAALEEDSLDDPDSSATATGSLSMAAHVFVRRPWGAATAPADPPAVPVPVMLMASGGRVVDSRAAPVGVLSVTGAAPALGDGHAGVACDHSLMADPAAAAPVRVITMFDSPLGADLCVGGEGGPPDVHPHPLDVGSSSQSSYDSIEEVIHTSTSTLAGRVAWCGIFATSRFMNDLPPYSSSS